MLVSLKTFNAPIAHSVERGAYIIKICMRRQGRGIDARWEQMEYKSSASTWRILECLVVPNIRMNSKDAYSNKQYNDYILLHPGNQKNRFVRVVKERVLRSLGVIRVGSNPTACKEFVGALKTFISSYMV